MDEHNSRTAASPARAAALRVAYARQVRPPRPTATLPTGRDTAPTRRPVDRDTR